MWSSTCLRSGYQLALHTTCMSHLQGPFSRDDLTTMTIYILYSVTQSVTQSVTDVRRGLRPRTGKSMRMSDKSGPVHTSPRPTYREEYAYVYRLGHGLGLPHHMLQL